MEKINRQKYCRVLSLSLENQYERTRKLSVIVHLFPVRGRVTLRSDQMQNNPLKSLRFLPKERADSEIGELKTSHTFFEYCIIRFPYKFYVF